MKDGTGAYLHPADNNPTPPRAQNKRFITNYMFLAAVARPRNISNGGSISGLSWILCWRRGKRDSKNRKKETPIMKTSHRQRGIVQVTRDRGGHQRNQGENAKTARLHDLLAAGWCKAPSGEGGDGDHPGCGGRHHTGKRSLPTHLTSTSMVLASSTPSSIIRRMRE
ncbi:unnamed protein product [Discosporangium mesarthrocarpum]